MSNNTNQNNRTICWNFSSFSRMSKIYFSNRNISVYAVIYNLRKHRKKKEKQKRKQNPENPISCSITF